MKPKTDIVSLVSDNKWEEIASLYSPEEIASALSFKDGLRVAYHLLYNKNWEEELQDFSINLLNKLRIRHSAEWNSSWKYDALIGQACDITNRHDERYLAYKRAFDHADSPPPRLLIELARCCVCPGTPPISYEQAKELVFDAIKETPYRDGVSLLCNIYSLQEDEANKEYWTQSLEKLKNADVENSPQIEPELLIEENID